MSEGPDPRQGEPAGPPPHHPDGVPSYPPYGAPYGPPHGGYPVVAPDHPQASTVLILGIVSVVACGLAGPFAWVMGNRVLGEIDAAPHQYGGRSNATIGRILGIVATALMGLALVIVVLAFVGVFAGLLSSTA